ncbi:MAG: hypothetical protein KH415_09605 [Clostridium sp.]|nr:hypothetical protein [Clostridium sp.]
MGLINKLKGLIGSKEDKILKQISSKKFEELYQIWCCKNTPQKIILKENARLSSDTYKAIKERFSHLEIDVIIIPWCFDIIAIDNKVVIKCRD